MKVLVTGAAGFLGRAVVDALLAEGHDPVCLVRPTRRIDDLRWPADRVGVVRGDLRQRGPWMDEVGGLEAVVHLAAATSGDFATQFASTVVATENLLEALESAPPARLVHISSFSCYDYSTPATGSVIDETSPLEPLPLRRDAYTRCKLIQETIVREFADATNTELVVLRPGAIFGPGTEWDHGAALQLGPFDIVFAPDSRMRLVDVVNCATAIALSVTAPDAPGHTLDLVDDDPPTHAEFHRRCRRNGATTRRAIPVPWAMVELVGRAIDLLDRRLLGRRAKLPELLELRRQQARWRDFAYPNSTARDVLAWSPARDLDTALMHMVRDRPAD